MTYITAHLPELDKLKLEFEENPDAVKRYIKYEGFSSTHSGSIDYLDMKIEEYYKSKEND